MKTILKSGIPAKMKALMLTVFDTTPIVQEVDVPIPGKGQVLIKINSSPINPSDWTFLRGLYSTKKTLPVIPGFEGSGVVVATANDFMSRRLLGKNVACFAHPEQNGTWAEYMVTNNNFAVPLRKNFDMEQGAMLLVNPLSAIAMIKITKKAGYTAIANTAAASALGQMMNRMCQDEKIDLVNIVRREEQEDLLKSQGAKYLVNSSSGNFVEELSALFHKVNVKLAFDAISGQMSSDLLNALPTGGEVMVYGALSEMPITNDPGRFIFEKKRISGFWLSEWITHQNILTLLSSFGKIQKFLTDKHLMKIQKRIPLEGVEEGIKLYTENMTSGKVLIQP